MNAPRGWSALHLWRGVTNFVPAPVLGGIVEQAQPELLKATDTLLPGGVATISFDDVPVKAKRCRLVLQYVYDASNLRRTLSRAITNMPFNSLSRREIYWLDQRALLNGKFSRTYEGNWTFTHPDAADGNLLSPSPTTASSKAVELLKH
jgi:hypothetical protein